MPELTPKLTVNTGGMFASKSSTLINQGERHLLAGHKVVYIKPEIDDRYGASEVNTHKGDAVEAVSVKHLPSILYVPEIVNADVVLIDEAQFFTRLVPVVNTLLELNSVVYVSGLDMDYKANAFDDVARLMAMADEVNKLKAVCNWCGKDSLHSAKLHGSSEDRVEVGGTGMYAPLCRECYQKFKNSRRI